MNNASRGYCLSTIRGHIEKQLEQLLQQVTTLAGTSPLRGLCRPRVACCETTIYNASPWTHFLLIVLAICPCEALYHVGLSLLLVIKVVFVVFPNSAGRIGNNSLSSFTVSDLLSVRYGRRQQRDRRRGRGASVGRSRCGSRDSRRGCLRVRPRP